MSCSPLPDPSIAFTGSDRIVVTGASSGIGAAIALRLNALGASVIANGRNEEKLEAVRDKAIRPDAFHPEALDLVSSMEGIPGWIKGLREKYGALTGLAHSAGQAVIASFMQYDPGEVRGFFEINFHAPLMLSKAILDRRNCSPGASLVFISSVAGVSPEKGQTVYGASKAALICAVRGMSKEFASRGVRVNCVSPGVVRTPMTEEALTLLEEDYLPKQESLQPLGLGTPEDVAGLVAFLLSPAARWITGQNYIIDGGRLA
jgi:NAD(P)-dependent dehydrogenase (short-subunit alcohol dehydrogenase family)